MAKTNQQLLLSFQIKMTAKESTQSDNLKVWTYCHVFLVMFSGLFLVATATTAMLILYFVPETDYITIEMDLISSLTVFVYLSAGLIVFGLLQLVFLVVVLLCFHNTQKQRTFVSIGCLATAMISMGILLLFAAQPQLLVEKTLPKDDDIFYDPINRSYAVAMKQYRHQTNQQVVESLRRLQTDEKCCLHEFDDQGDDSCLINTGNGEILRSSRNCVDYFRDFYLNWHENSADIIQIMAIVFCVVLGLAVLVNIYLLLFTNSGSYTVQRREPGKYRKNLSSFTYVPFETDLPVRKGLKGETVESDTVKTEVVNPDVFWITKNNVREIAVFDPSICVMHDY